MLSILEQYNLYLQMNDGPQVNKTLRPKVAALDLELASQSVPLA